MIVWITFAAFLISGCLAFITLKVIIPLLTEAGLTGTDLHKGELTEIPEMGGLGMVVGISGGLVLLIGAEAFLNVSLDVVPLLAVMATILVVSFIGVFDDLLDISQLVKAISPIFAALPLMAIRAGATKLKIPLLGEVKFGLAYPLVLIPLGVTGASNAVNMLAGFNGMEVGVGLVAISFLAVIAGIIESWTAFLILMIGLASLISTLYFNWYPARVMIGDVGTLTIGALIASAVIIGNFETAGVIIIIPYFIDFILKALNGFPSSEWAGKLDEENGKLICPGKFPVSFPQLVMKISGGIKERNLTLVFMFIESLAGMAGVLVYLLR